MLEDICLRCKQRPKRKSAQFCSKRCTEIAAKKAPELLRVPKNHVFYKNVKRSFGKNWRNKHSRRPTICRIYLITWTAKMRRSFDKYRERINKKHKLPKNQEVKRFRSERRACRVGDPGHPKCCKRPDCALCQAIRTGFKSSLENKRRMVLSGAHNGVRFGGGVYLATSSSKAYEYAKNVNNGSRYRIILATRVVLGRTQKLNHNEHFRLAPNKGYDSVEGWVGSPELVVYNVDAVRPAYLILLK
ncbi:hypothetical protein BDW22DRAFT_1333172 [Trametopsis cervina]|nr:hypothetical protein BDW22DRAFT_1333172 [Trametopsis cervina]